MDPIHRLLLGCTLLCGLVGAVALPTTVLSRCAGIRLTDIGRDAYVPFEGPYTDDRTGNGPHGPVSGEGAYRGRTRSGRDRLTRRELRWSARSRRSAGTSRVGDDLD
jgi:hypothetical protein